MERKYAEICHRSGGVLEKLKLIVTAAPCWAWPLIATMMTCCALPVHYSKPGRHFTVSFLILHLLSCCGLLACFAQHGVQRLECIINMLSHEFSYNLGMHSNPCDYLY